MRKEATRRHSKTATATGVWPRSVIAGPRSGTHRQSRRQAFNDAGHAHFLTFSCFKRAQLLMDDRVCRQLARSIDESRKEHRFDVWAYVFMPDHVHLLIRPRRDVYSIASILKSIKAPFAKWLVAAWMTRHPERLRRLRVSTSSRVTYRVWQRGGGFDRNLFSPKLIGRAIDYIEFNPVRKGLAESPEQWRWSSAAARTGKDGVMLKTDEVTWECCTDGK